MSQSYLVNCKASVCEVKSSKDSVVTKLVLTNIVDKETQKEILVDTLKEHGFKEVDAQTLTREKDGIIQVVDLTDMTVTATVEKKETIKREKSIQARTNTSSGLEKFRLEQQAKLEQSIAITDEEREKVGTKLMKEISTELQATEEERKKELNQVVKDVYVESLKKKAASLGQITSIQESTNGGEYELRIKISD